MHPSLTRTLKHVVRLSVTILIIGAVTFVLAEIVFRTYHHFNPTFLFPDNSYNRFRPKPFADDWSFKLNSKGFKDKEFQDNKEPETYRILGIGDSFAYGVVPYEHNFLTLLEQGIISNNRPVEVINMGIPGISIKEYLSLLVNEGLHLKPDLVMICIFIGNDFEEIRQRWYRHSYAASFIKYVVDLHKHFQPQIIHGAGTYHDHQDTFSVEKYLELEASRSAIYRVRANSFRTAFEDSVRVLETIRTVCRHKGIDLFVLGIPDELQVDEELQREVITTLKARREDFDFAFPNKLLSEALRERGIQYLDLLVPFMEASKHRRLYKPHDSHWNIAGNALAARLIGSRLSALVP